MPDLGRKQIWLRSDGYLDFAVSLRVEARLMSRE